jgi:hypothetical protein
VHQVMCAREEREGVTGGATGGQRRGVGRTREVYVCMYVCAHACKQERQEVKYGRLGCCGMEDSSWEGRNDLEGRGRGGESG